MALYDTNDISLRPIVLFDPTRWPHTAWAEHLDIEKVAPLIQAKENTIYFCDHVDALIINGPIAVELLPQLSQSFWYLDGNNTFRPVQSLVQDIASDANGLCVPIPRGLWPVAQHLLRERGIHFELPLTRLQRRFKRLLLPSPLDRVIERVRQVPFGRFITDRPVVMARAAAVAASSWQRHRVVLVVQTKQEAQQLNKKFEVLQSSEKSPACWDKCIPQAVIPETLQRFVESVEGRPLICFIVNARSVTTQRMAYALGSLRRARIYGFESIDDLNYSDFEETRLACFFGVQRVSLLGSVRVIRQKIKQFAQSLPDDAGAFVVKRDLIWTNAQRNQYLVNTVRFLEEGSTLDGQVAFGTKLQQLRAKFAELPPKILVVVENEIHRQALLRTATSELNVATFEDVAKMWGLHDWDVIVRADATPGIPQGLQRFYGERDITMLDLCDESHPVLVDFSIKRRKAIRAWEHNVPAIDEEAAVQRYLLRIRGASR